MDTGSAYYTHFQCPQHSYQKKAHFSNRALKIIKKFDYTGLPMIDQLIAYFYVLDNAAGKMCLKI